MPCAVIRFSISHVGRMGYIHSINSSHIVTQRWTMICICLNVMYNFLWTCTLQPYKVHLDSMFLLHEATHCIAISVHSLLTKWTNKERNEEEKKCGKLLKINEKDGNSEQKLFSFFLLNWTPKQRKKSKTSLLIYLRYLLWGPLISSWGRQYLLSWRSWMYILFVRLQAFRWHFFRCILLLDDDGCCCYCFIICYGFFSIAIMHVEIFIQRKQMKQFRYSLHIFGSFFCGFSL